MKNAFLDRLANEILIGDGAMGTMLYARGIYINRCFDELNLSNPKIVQDIHREYLDAGADFIETNTFGANSFKLTPHGLEHKLYEINYWGAALAREVAGYSKLVAGSMGPLGRPIQPFGSVTKDEATASFIEQAKALEAGGIDLFILETFNDLEMLIIAVKALQAMSKKPIIAQVSFSDEAIKVYGVTPVKVVRRLEALQVAAAGINCSTGPQPILEKIQQMARMSSIKLSAMPNAGMPKFVDGRLIYLASPEYFAEYAKRFIQSGVSIIGGCCGTTPDHIRAIKAAVKALRPTKVFEEIKFVERQKVVREVEENVIKSELQRKLQGNEFVTCIEINPPRSPDVEKVLQGCQIIKDGNVDAVNIPDGPRASAKMSSLALAALIQMHIKMDTILHYTCRDRNILGMQSDLLGAHAMGLRNILCVTGDPPKLGDYPTATAVFNVDAIGLVRIANNLNHGLDLAGNPIEKPTTFYLGVGVNPGAIDFEVEMDRLRQKIAAGAEYVLTQPIFEFSLFEKFREALEKITHLPIIAGILPLISYRNAEFLHNEVPGMCIPEKIRTRFYRATDVEESKKIGIEIAQAMLEQLKPQVQGIYLMPPFGRYRLALDVLAVLKNEPRSTDKLISNQIAIIKN